MINLHTHSEYSILDGLGGVKDILLRVKEMGQTAVGITDHASISCLPELLKYSKEYSINPIVGCEFYIVDDVAKVPKERRYHLTVWAKNWLGVQSIMRQLTLANRQYYYRPRLTFKQALDFKECFIGTACSFGILAHDQYEDIYKSFFETYGADMFCEIMPHVVDLPEKPGFDLQREVNHRAVTIRAKIGGKTLLTNDAHYVKKEDAETHRLLLCTQYGKSAFDFKGWGGEFYLKSRSEMIAAFSKTGIPSLDPKLYAAIIAEGINSSQFIADHVSIEKPKITINLPSIYPDEVEAFLRIILDGWKNKIDGIIDNIVPYHDRLMFELKVIKKMDFQKYFLVVHDMISWARGQGIMVGPARGSSAGSLVCYLMGIVQVDPLKFGLYFERFLNPDRVEMPDIDVDFQDDRRAEVFKYVREKYGEDKTAFINTFGRVTVKSAFRDVARAHNISPMKINELSTQIEDKESFKTVSDLVAFKKDWPGIIEQAEHLDGAIRQVGCHACGFVISSSPLEEVCVLERRKRAEGGQVFVTNWDKNESENFGLLKVDILGLTTLSVLNRARDLIFERKGKLIDYTEIPLDDPGVIKLFQEALTDGIFQFEGAGMKTLLRGVKPKNFREITDCTALYRPGPLQSGQTQKYVDVAKGEATAVFKDELLRPILKDTHGQLVYQEQIMQIFNRLGNFTWAEADRMRKIIGKKLGKDEFNKHKEHFVRGCGENKIDEYISSGLFDEMAEFANYVFNLSHAVSYTMISFWAAWLKVYHPVEFFTAGLSHASDDGADVLIGDAKSFGINIDIPDINVSGQYYQIDENGSIRYPLAAVKGVGVKAVATILHARTKGPFSDLEDFKSRIDRRACNVRVVEKLIDAGAFERLGIKEIDPEKRARKFTEIIAGFSELPTIRLKNPRIDKNGLLLKSKEYEKCAAERGKAGDYIFPVFTSPHCQNIMVINNITKHQKHLLSGQIGKYLLDQLKINGVKKEDIYMTGVLKCRSTEKKCIECSAEAIKAEIRLMKPALIICFVGGLVPMFEKGGKMAKLQGQVKYNSEFDAHVLFSYSPQYAIFQKDKAQGMFENAISKMNTMLEV